MSTGAESEAADAFTQHRLLGAGTLSDLPVRLTAYLNRIDRVFGNPNLRPRDASTLIIIDRGGATPKVLLGRRHAGHKFLPGKFVFPGGRVERGDREATCATELDPRIAQRLLVQTNRPNPGRARALALAAIRETFEETGLLLGRKHADAVRMPPGPWRAFASAQVIPDLAEMHYIARAVTPPRRTRRFDTRFFAVDAEAIAGRVDGVVGPDAELVELVWLPITEVTRLDMPGITHAVLEELLHRIESGFSHDLPVPVYRWVGSRFSRVLV